MSQARDITISFLFDVIRRGKKGGATFSHFPKQFVLDYITH